MIVTGGVLNERRVVFMNSQDMADRNLEEKDVVNLVSNYDGVERKAEQFLVVPYDIPKGNAAAYFPETNMLIPIDKVAKESGTPISKSVVIKITQPDGWGDPPGWDIVSDLG